MDKQNTKEFSIQKWLGEKKHILKISLSSALRFLHCKSRCGAQEPLSCACLSAERSRDGLGRLHCFYQPIKVHESWYQFWGFDGSGPDTKSRVRCMELCLENLKSRPNQSRNAEGHLSKGRGGRIWQGPNAQSRNQTTGSLLTRTDNPQVCL